MAGQSVNFDFTSRGADKLASDFRKTGDTAVLAAKGARAAADALRASEAGGKAAADGLHKAERAANLLDIAEHELNAELDTTNTKLLEQFGAAELAGKGLQGAGRDAGKAGAGFSGLAGAGGIPGGGMAAAIAAGVVLSPVLVTVGTGLAGLAAAAVSTVGPILKAGTATAEAQKALASLDPAQKAAYDSLGALKDQFKGFGKTLEPQVLDLFNRGLRIASGLMADITPVTKAVGTALGQVLGAIDKEFRSGTWQQFFQFMGDTAGTDIKLLGQNFTDLLHTLPPLLEALQPLAQGFLEASDNAVKLAGSIANFGKSTDETSKSVGTNTGLLGFLSKAVENVTSFMKPGGVATGALNTALAGIPGSAGKAGAGLHDAAGHAQTYAQYVQQSAKATTALMDAQSAAVSTQLAYGNDILTSANDAQTFHDKLKASKGMIGLHTQAQRDSFGAAQTYIGDLARQASSAIASGHGTDAAIGAIRAGFPALDTAKSKDKQYWQEVKTLVGWLQQLELIKAINSAIHVSGTGQWSVTPGKIGLPGGTAGGPFGAAAGLYVSRGTGPTADDVMIRASRGELIVPANMVRAGAVDHLRGQIPGFASGGVAGSYGPGPVGGLPAWGNAELAATQRAIARDTAKSMADAINQAKTQAANPFAGISGVPSGAKISGSAQAAMNFAKSILWAYGWGQNQFPPLRDLWMGESGWNYLAYNASSGATGIPQSLPGSKMASAGADWRTNPATQIRWGLGYIKQVYGSPANAYGRWLGRSPHWYGEGGLIPGYASGGTVGQQGAAWLRAWQTRHGGGFGAAWGPVAVNQQIPEMAAAVQRARALSGAAGLSPGQHRFWAGAAADETRRLAVLGRELTTERAWRTQLGVNELGLDKEIRAAGNLPSLAGPVRGWKAQLGRDKATVAAISRMLGYSDAYLAAHKPPPPGPVLPKITHTYGGDVANTLGAVLASALGPFTGARAGALVMDTGGTLRPGWQTVYNGTGRPESLVPARGGGGIHLHLTVNAPVGSQQQLEDWYVKTANKLAQHGRLTQAVRAASR